MSAQNAAVRHKAQILRELIKQCGTLHPNTCALEPKGFRSTIATFQFVFLMSTAGNQGSSHKIWSGWRLWRLCSWMVALDWRDPVIIFLVSTLVIIITVPMPLSALPLLWSRYRYCHAPDQTCNRCLTSFKIVHCDLHLLESTYFWLVVSRTCADQFAHFSEQASKFQITLFMNRPL